MSFLRTAMCPSCFHSFSLHRPLFRCIIPECAGQGEDEIYGRARGLTIPVMGRILQPSSRGFATPRQAECDICHNISRAHICPHCHGELSYDIGLVDQYMIAIIGSSAAGKTHYIASLIHHLQQATGKNFGLTVRMLGDATQQRWEHDFYTPLFINKTRLQPTPSAVVDAQIKVPLVLRVTFSRGRVRRAINISFFDTAGEDMALFSTMSLQNRYICLADGLILLLDPLQIPAVRQQITTLPLPPVDPKAAPENIVGRLRDLFRARTTSTSPPESQGTHCLHAGES